MFKTQPLFSSTHSQQLSPNFKTKCQIQNINTSNIEQNIKRVLNYFVQKPQIVNTFLPNHQPQTNPQENYLEEPSKQFKLQYRLSIQDTIYQLKLRYKTSFQELLQENQIESEQIGSSELNCSEQFSYQQISFESNNLINIQDLSLKKIFEQEEYEELLYIYSLALMCKYYKVSSIIPSNKNIMTIFLVCLEISIKVAYDEIDSNILSKINKITNTEIKVLQNLEVKILQELNYNIRISGITLHNIMTLFI